MSGSKNNPSSAFRPLSSDTGFIPYGRQWIDDDDIAAVVEVLRSDWLTCGPKVTEFESALAEYCGAKHAVAVSNGTAALHVAMLAAGIGPGDRVLTSAITFLASANCAEFVGATADFTDIDPETLCMSVETLAAAWRADVKAVVPVDFAGYPCLTRELAEYAHDRGALVIEDASHAIGAGRDGFNVGALPWVDMTTFSFHPVKTMTTGEGGAILTNDDELAERCRLFRNHGMIRGQMADGGWRMADGGGPLSSVLCPPSSERGPWWYEMHELGYNYRITDIQCALGLSQLKKLDRFVARRQEIVDRYNAAFVGLDHVRIPPTSDLRPPSSALRPLSSGLLPAWHLYVLQIDFDALGTTRTDFMARLRKHGVGSQVHYIPVHLQPYYCQKYGCVSGRCPAAETYYGKCLSLPLYPALSEEDVRLVVGVVEESLPT